MTISFIGLGLMGSRMATRLLDAGYELTVYNRSEEPRYKLKQQGAKTADSASAAVKGADIVFSMLANPAAVESVFLGPKGALTAMNPDSLWVDCSTVSPAFNQRCQEACTQQGVGFVDAPVSGTTPHAEKGELLFLVGGDKQQVALLEPYFDAMGREVQHVGAAGQGIAFKVVVNMMLAQSMVQFSEAVHLGERLGIDSAFLLDKLPNMAVAAPFLAFKAQKIKAADYEEQFPLELMYKDLRLASETAEALQQPLLLVELAKGLFAQAIQAGYSRKDFSAIHAYLAAQKD